MKKVLLSLVTFLYLMLSTGFSIEWHFCMGKFAGVSFNSGHHDKCSRCGMTEENKSGCCRDEVKFYKFEDSFKNNAQHLQVFTGDLFFIAPVSTAFFYSHNYCPLQLKCSPPKYVSYSGPPIHIRNCVFRL